MSRKLVFNPTASGADTPAFVCTCRDAGRDAVWVRAEGELDIATAPRIERTLRRAELRARLVVLDLRQLTFIDCSGVHRIVDAAIRARRVGRRLILVRGPSQVDRVLALTGVSDFMEIRDLDPGEPAVQVLLQLAHEDQANLSAPPTNNQDLGKDDLGCVGRALRGEVRPSLQEAPASKGTDVLVVQATQSEGINSRAALQTETDMG